MNNLIGENEKMTNQIIKCGSMEIPQLKLEMNTEEIELYMNNMITENPEILDAIDTMTMYEMEIYDLNEAKKNVYFDVLRSYNDLLTRLDGFKSELMHKYGDKGLDAYELKYQPMEVLFENKKIELFKLIF